MYSVAVEITFEGGHYLTMRDGKKELPHSHKWRVRAMVRSEELDDYGLVMDFHELLQLLREAAEPLSRGDYINELPPFDQENPSAERLGQYIYQRLSDNLPPGVHLSEVKVWETADCFAIYQG